MASQQLSQPTRPSIPQAEPMIAFLSAIKESDVDKFQGAFIRSIGEQDQPWSEKLEQSKGSMKRRLGDYSIDDLKFAYEGDDQTGMLTARVDEKRFLKLKVAKEDGKWKLATH